MSLSSSGLGKNEQSPMATPGRFRLNSSLARI
jgi:hypothetical protein